VGTPSEVKKGGSQILIGGALSKTLGDRQEMKIGEIFFGFNKFQ